MLTALALVPVLALAAQEASPAPAEPLAWDEARAEHLWNRAAFGADARTVARSVELGPEATVARLFATETWAEEPFYARKRADEDMVRKAKGMSEEQREERLRELKREDRAQAIDFLDWWSGRMLAGQYPLVERMTLFWHGHFTSSMEVVKGSYEMIKQNQTFRRHALGSFRELLHAVARDPAMLVYLDNTRSKKDRPNENFARELLELFTLGEGNYSEEDVHEVARAFTGWGERAGRFQFDAKRHDGGQKRVLGVEGRLDGGDVLEILLAQEACARHVARALLVEFEGVEPAPGRLERYAARLRSSGWRIDEFLRALFLDEEFYAEEKRATRVSSPIEFLVGSARRLGASPEPRLVVAGASLLGQRLFFPPSVRGWEGGRAWATTSSLPLRGELAGLMLGRLRGRDLRTLEREEGMVSMAEEEPAPERPDGAMAPAKAKGKGKGTPELRALEELDSLPRLNLTRRRASTGAESDAELARALCAELLAIPVPAALEAHVVERVEQERSAAGLRRGAWRDDEERAEPFLRALAHEILSLPEAQLD